MDQTRLSVALLSTKVEYKKWNITATMKYLTQQMNSSIDYLSAYLVLPIFSGKSLADIADTDCSNHRKQETLVGKINIQYSLFIGEEKNVVHTIYLKMPENSSAYDVMTEAKTVEFKYNFLQRDASGRIYVYEMVGITNDPEAGKFWLIYTENEGNDKLIHHNKSPERIILADGNHLIMWYRAINLVADEENGDSTTASTSAAQNDSITTTSVPLGDSTTATTSDPLNDSIAITSAPRGDSTTATTTDPLNDSIATASASHGDSTISAASTESLFY